MRFYIKTLGCQYNEWDAARLAFVLTKLGLEQSDEENADIAFILNCSVRQTAVNRTFGFAKNLRESGKRVYITGCVLDEDKRKLAQRGFNVWDNSDLSTLKEILDLDKDVEKIFKNSLAASNLIPITRGCNNFCSYCAVPYVRGREVSRTIEEIVENCKKVIEAGNKEIWLLGQNVNSYNPNNEVKSRNNGKSDFTLLLEQINALPGDFKINFTSNHPKDMSDDIVEAIAILPKVVKRIHLPLQSGSNKILKLMNRPYTKEQYLELVKKIKNRIKDVEITTDTIVGFPGETEADFQETVAVLKEVNYTQVYNNKYSPRSGTKAFSLGDPIPWEEKQRRWRILNELVNRG